MRKGTLDIDGYLKWYQTLVDEENAPQYIGQSRFTVNPVTIREIDHDEEYGEMYLIRTADEWVNAYVPARFVEPRRRSESREPVRRSR